MIIKCPDYILTAIKLLEESGFEAYAVGGCIRDSIMNIKPHDWDMTTSATPEEILSVFKEYRTIPTGIKHGTITVIINDSLIEITTMRIDGVYNDNRRPDNVEFTKDIVKDLSRRDFTSNAIAYNPKTGLIDPFNGYKDINNKIIKCVGNPDKRFNEDALRIIRGIRFASVLGFTIENETSDSIHRNKNLLHNVANERIREELIKLLCGIDVESILLEYKDVIFTVIPELKSTDGFLQHTSYHIYDVWTHTAKLVSNITNNPVFRVAALLHDVSKPDKFYIDEDGIGHFKGHAKKSAKQSVEILSRLRFPKKDIQRISEMISLHEIRPDGNRKRIAHLCSDYSPEIILDTLELIEADSKAKNPDFYDELHSMSELAKTQVEEIISNNECIKINQLDINGSDIKDLGFKGKEISLVMKLLLESVIDKEISNNKSELIKKAESLI